MPYPQPKGGASLLLSFNTQRVLIIGGSNLAATRTFAFLDSNSHVTVLCPRALLSGELVWRHKQGEIDFLEWADVPHFSGSTDEAQILDAYLASHKTDFVCITDTMISSSFTCRTKESAERLRGIAKKHHCLVNVADVPSLSDFAFATTHRFGESPLQVTVTTNGQGCRLATRIKREIVSALPKDVGMAVVKVGQLRALARENEAPEDEACEESTPNTPVPQRTSSETHIEATLRRMKWVGQVSEYWPLSRLVSLTKEEMQQVLSGENYTDTTETSPIPTHHDLTLNRVTPKGRILLVGSGPGHPSLLTLATHNALTKHADLVLADKLVPAAVLDLIPKHVTIRIARKFPGNAEGAQMEMMEAAIEAANNGLTVVRLKQGDPVVYGRAGEEVLYFRKRGYEPIVVPGVSSALAAPTFAGIPVTQRGVAESFVVCTGVGRNGKSVRLPGYERSRTLVVLMGVARIKQMISVLTEECSEGRKGPAYPRQTPIAIIERASMQDQRIIASTLENIEQALESAGEQRPPGLFVVGWSVLALWGKGDVTVLDKGSISDEERIGRWLGEGHRWRIEDGLDERWSSL